ncbi:MAG TPA: glycosyltransferase 87 family protein [Thermoanaerobaculia bacterium]|nr:glycosyltransferase 87 family protein [Thermoanaerobaculia bacterium]
MTDDGGSRDLVPGVPPNDDLSFARDATRRAAPHDPAALSTWLLSLLPSALALAGWWKLREQLYRTHWGEGPTLTLLVVASIVLVLAVPRVARLVFRHHAAGAGGGGDGRAASRRVRLLTLALAAGVLWSAADDVAELRANLARERAWMLDIGVATWAAAVRFADLGQNPYTTPNQPHQVTGGRGVTETGGRVEIFGVPYFYGFPYFPAMFLSYAPFRWIDPGQHSIRIGNAFWLAVLLAGIAWLAYRLAPPGRRPQAAALSALLLTTTTGLGGQLFYFGITDIVIPVYVVLALLASSYRRDLLAGCLMGLAFSAKLHPGALLAVVFFAWVVRRGGLRPALAGFAVVSVIVLLPFVLWHPAGFLSATFLFYLTHHAAGDTTSLWYYLPEALRFPFQALGGLAALAVALSPLWTGSNDQRDLLRAMVVASLLFLAASPMIHLNYQFALVPLACVALAADAAGPFRGGRSRLNPPAPLFGVAHA